MCGQCVAGVAVEPAAGAVIAVGGAGEVMSHTGRYKFFPVRGAGFLVGTGLLATMGSDTSRTTAGVYMALVGIGLGFLLQMTTTIAQNSVEMRDMGVASACVTLVRSIGGSLGVAVFGSLFAHATAGHLPATTDSGTAAQITASALVQLPAQVKHAYQEAVASVTQHIFLLAACLCAAAFLAAHFMKGGPAARQARHCEAGRRAGPQLSDRLTLCTTGTPDPERSSAPDTFVQQRNAQRSRMRRDRGRTERRGRSEVTAAAPLNTVAATASPVRAQFHRFHAARSLATASSGKPGRRNAALARAK
jgi:hypothetical protein